MLVWLGDLEASMSRSLQRQLLSAKNGRDNRLPRWNIARSMAQSTHVEAYRWTDPLIGSPHASTEPDVRVSPGLVFRLLVHDSGEVQQEALHYLDTAEVAAHPIL